ncbi:hypothetical protein HUK80_17840 [Flavobacterium sp. MAH-1]|uniref:Uncharacterized protein n=1 Tax=Flavobacterium agri TaxID=2743471 RepID=A0A7Y8Y5B8_9FLAO|nr:hypothetical protein [Flavobacterium agri]NUY82769.1 hypothetical protein [Flavobacterium agri]NYA72791.1 hypothetical protein [Flavobacterium agri]
MSSLKYFLLLIVICTICFCKGAQKSDHKLTQTSYSLEVAYDDNDDFDSVVRKNYLLKTIKADKKDDSVIYFTGGFFEQSVVLYEGSQNKIVKNLSTIDRVGLAGYHVFNNTGNMKIDFSGLGVVFNYNKKNIKKYKYLYISKSNAIIYVLYSNTYKPFM